MKIYIPEYENGNCAILQSGEVIRVYETRPTPNASVNYIDYYFNSHYVSRNGTQSFGAYTTIPSCISNNDITNNIFNRFDLDSILICFFILVIFCFYFPFKMFSRMFGRWLKL